MNKQELHEEIEADLHTFFYFITNKELEQIMAIIKTAKDRIQIK